MSNSQKGITAKMSNWILTKLNALIAFLEVLKNKIETIGALQKEDEILTYEQYRSRVQLSERYCRVNTQTKSQPSRRPIKNNDDDADAEEAGCLVLC